MENASARCENEPLSSAVFRENSIKEALSHAGY